MGRKNKKSLSFHTKRKNLAKNETILTADSGDSAMDEHSKKDPFFWRNLSDYSNRKTSHLRNFVNVLSDQTPTSNLTKSDWWKDISPPEPKQLTEQPGQSNNEALFEEPNSPNLEEDFIPPKKIFKPKTRSNRYSRAFNKIPHRISKAIETSTDNSKNDISIRNLTDDSITQNTAKRTSKRLFNRSRDKRKYSNAYNFEVEEIKLDDLASGNNLSKRDQINASTDFVVEHISTDIGSSQTSRKQVETVVNVKSSLDVSNKRTMKTRSLSAEFPEDVIVQQSTLKKSPTKIPSTKENNIPRTPRQTDLSPHLYSLRSSPNKSSLKDKEDSLENSKVARKLFGKSTEKNRNYSEAFVKSKQSNSNNNSNLEMSNLNESPSLRKSVRGNQKKSIILNVNRSRMNTSKQDTEDTIFSPRGNPKKSINRSRINTSKQDAEDTIFSPQKNIEQGKKSLFKTDKKLRNYSEAFAKSKTIDATSKEANESGKSNHSSALLRHSRGNISNRSEEDTLKSEKGKSRKKTLFLKDAEKVRHFSEAFTKSKEVQNASIEEENQHESGMLNIEDGDNNEIPAVEKIRQSSKRNLSKHIIEQDKANENVIERSAEVQNVSFEGHNLNEISGSTTVKKIKSPFMFRKDKSRESKSLSKLRDSTKNYNTEKLKDSIRQSAVNEYFSQEKSSSINTSKLRKSLSVIIDRLNESKNATEQNIHNSVDKGDPIVKQSLKTSHTSASNKSPVSPKRKIGKSPTASESVKKLSDKRKSTKDVEVPNRSNVSESIFELSTIPSITEQRETEQRNLFAKPKSQQKKSMEKEFSPILVPPTPRGIIDRPRRSMQVSDSDSVISKFFDNSLMSSTKIIPNKFVNIDTSDEEEELRSLRSENNLEQPNSANNMEESSKKIKRKSEKHFRRSSVRNISLQVSKIIEEQENISINKADSVVSTKGRTSTPQKKLTDKQTNKTDSNLVSTKDKRSSVQENIPEIESTAENVSNIRKRKTVSDERNEISNNENVKEIEILPQNRSNLSVGEIKRRRMLERKLSSKFNASNKLSQEVVEKNLSAVQVAGKLIEKNLIEEFWGESEDENVISGKANEIETMSQEKSTNQSAEKEKRNLTVGEIKRRQMSEKKLSSKFNASNKLSQEVVEKNLSAVQVAGKHIEKNLIEEFWGESEDENVISGKANEIETMSQEKSTNQSAEKEKRNLTAGEIKRRQMSEKKLSSKFNASNKLSQEVVEKNLSAVQVAGKLIEKNLIEEFWGESEDENVISGKENEIETMSQEKSTNQSAEKEKRNLTVGEIKRRQMSEKKLSSKFNASNKLSQEVVEKNLSAVQVAGKLIEKNLIEEFWGESEDENVISGKENEIETMSQEKSTNQSAEKEKRNLTVGEIKRRQMSEKKLSSKFNASNKLSQEVVEKNLSAVQVAGKLIEKNLIEEFWGESEDENVISGKANEIETMSQEKSTNQSAEKEKRNLSVGEIKRKQMSEKRLSSKFKGIENVISGKENEIETMSQEKSTNQSAEKEKRNLSVGEIKRKQMSEKKLSSKFKGIENVISGKENEIETKSQEKSTNQSAEKEKRNLSVGEIKRKQMSEKKLISKFKGIAKENMKIGDISNNENRSEIESIIEYETENILQEKLSNRSRLLENRQSKLSQEVIEKNLIEEFSEESEDENVISGKENEIQTMSQEKSTNQSQSAEKKKEKNLSAEQVAGKLIEKKRIEEFWGESEDENVISGNEIETMPQEKSTNQSAEKEKRNLSVGEIKRKQMSEKRFKGNVIIGDASNINEISGKDKKQKNVLKNIRNPDKPESIHSNYSVDTEILYASSSENEPVSIGNQQRNKSLNLPQSHVAKNMNSAEGSLQKNREVNTLNRTSIVDLVSINEESIRKDKSNLLANFLKRAAICQRTATDQFKKSKIEEIEKNTKNSQRQPTSNSKEMANKKMTDFFKKGDLKPIPKKNMENKPFNINKMIDGELYKPRKLFKGSYWCNDRLYKYFQKKISEKNSDANLIIESEEIMESIWKSVRTICKSKNYPKNEVEEMKKNLARNGIIVTTYDFFLFVDDYLPYDFSRKVVPRARAYRLGTEVPYDPSTAFKDIQY